MLIGLLYCVEDRPHLKASIFYSMLKSTVPRTRTERSQKNKGLKRSASGTVSGNSSSDSGSNFNELNCMDEQIENLIFRLCVLSQMFIEFCALPPKLGKTENTMMQMARQMRSTIYFEVFKTFI